jgi:hypothetical protein
MTTNIGDPTATYSNVQIPTLDEAADIRSALRVYHYGSDTADPDEQSTEFKNSIAGIIDTLDQNKRDLGVSIVGNSANLDNILTSGVYYAPSASATSGSNYPLISGIARAGFLVVETSNAVTMQTYLTVDSNPSLNAVMFTRTRIGTSWSPAVWSRLSDNTHNHDERYLQTILITPELDRRPTQINGKNASGNDLTGTRKIIVAAPVEVNGEQVPNITPAQQATLQPGDLWFW